MAVSNLVFCFPLFVIVTVLHDSSNGTALAALPGPSKNTSAGNTPVEMVQEGSACNSLLGYCCKWELAGESGGLVLSQIFSSFQETQQYPRFCSVWVWSCSMWHKWNALAILSLYGSSKPECHEGGKEDVYSSVVISEWVFPLKQFCLCESDFSFFQRVSVETRLEDCLHQKFEVQWHFLTLISFPCWWQRKATLNHYHASSCFHKTLELSAQNSIKPAQQQSRVQYVIKFKLAH